MSVACLLNAESGTSCVTFNCVFCGRGPLMTHTLQVFSTKLTLVVNNNTRNYTTLRDWLNLILDVLLDTRTLSVSVLIHSETKTHFQRRKVALITAHALSNLLHSLVLSSSSSLSLSPQQAGSCHESLTALSVGKWLFKYGAVQRTPFNTHRCSFHRFASLTLRRTHGPSTHRTPARVSNTCQCHWCHRCLAGMWGHKRIRGWQRRCLFSQMFHIETTKNFQNDIKEYYCCYKCFHQSAAKYMYLFS